MTTVDVISGFLGAGKTTLLRRLIAQAYPGERLMLLENEFGAVGVDGAFLKDTGVELAELNSGCICCSISGDFTGQLQTMIEWNSPDRVLIEPSGVAKLSDVCRGLRQVQQACREDEVVIGSLVTVVDASRAASYAENFGQFYLDQISHADCLLLTHTEGLDADTLSRCCLLLQRHNRRAAIIQNPQELSASQLRRTFVHWQTEEEPEQVWKVLAGPDGRPVIPRPHSRPTEAPFISWSRETRRRYSQECLTAILQALHISNQFGQILRAKGCVAGHDGCSYEFDLLPDDTEVRRAESMQPDVPGRLCVIGCNLDTDALDRLFTQGGVS